MKWNMLILPIIITLYIIGCANSPDLCTIQAPEWPDGTRVSAFQGDTLIGRSSIYGGRTAISLSSDSFWLRVAHPTLLSNVLEYGIVDDGLLTLPLPVRRKTYGSWHLGLISDDPAINVASILQDMGNDFTTITAPIINSADISLLHNHGIELIYPIDNMYDSSIISRLERVGVDGIYVRLSGDFGQNFIDRYRELREMTHLLGMSMSLSIVVPYSDEKTPTEIIDALCSGEPETLLPDEIRLHIKKDKTDPVVSATYIGEIVHKMTFAGYSESMISVELYPAIQKFRMNSDGMTVPVDIELGDIASLKRIIASGAGIRLRDGSLRVGDRGNIYIVEDISTMIEKISLLRTEYMPASAGIHLQYADIYPWLTLSELATLSETISTPGNYPRPE